MRKQNNSGPKKSFFECFLKDCSKRWVTLIDLLVALTMVIILSTVAFYSFWNYFVTARDSARVVELDNIESALHSYAFRKWHYPTTTKWEDITYSGSLVWTQADFSDNISSIILYANGVVDPLTETSYTYTVKNSKKEFQIAWVLENSYKYFSFWNDQANAAAKNTLYGTTIMRWNYNGEVVSANVSGKTYVLALPSIMTRDLSYLTVPDIVNNNALVYHDYTNLPATYNDTEFDTTSNLDFWPNSLVVWSGSILDLKKSTQEIELVRNLYNAYNGNILWNKLSVNRVDSTDLFLAEPPMSIKTYACDLVNVKLKFPVECDLNK